MRPTWAEVSKSALLHNYRALVERAQSHGAEILSVVKADAYGHDLSICGPALAGAGADWLGISNVEEGVRLREVLGENTKPHILVMGGAWKGEGEAVLEHDLTPVVWEPYQLDLLEQAARRAGLTRRTVCVHLEIDTGMARQGVRLRDLPPVLDRLTKSPTLRMEGLLTHYASPEVMAGENAAQSAEQTSTFCRAALLARHVDLYPQYVHAGQSAVLASGESLERRLHELARGLGARLLVRPGIALYGYALHELRPGGEQPAELAEHLQAVLRWKTRVISLRDVETGATAGYNATWRATRPSRLALVPAGYADGFWRALSGPNQREEVLGWPAIVRGQVAPVVGRVSMDITILDVTDIPGVEIGDEVELLGASPANDAWAAAKRIGSIPYEVLCGIGARVPRVAVD